MVLAVCSPMRKAAGLCLPVLGPSRVTERLEVEKLRLGQMKLGPTIFG